MMKLPAFTKTALAVALAGTIGLTAAVPATLAQDNTTKTEPAAPQAKQPGQELQRPGEWRHHHMRVKAERGDNGGGLLGLLTSPRGAEALEVAFVRLSHRIDLTDAQKPLFDDLKTTALTAQTTFSDAAKAIRDAAMPKDQQPDTMARIKARLSIETARLEAMNTVLPKLEAFMNSLDDAQKAALMPQRDHVGMQRHQGMGKDQKGHRGNMPAQPEAPAAQPKG